jgi:hypothetical protein
LKAKDEGQSANESQFETATADATREVVRKQIENVKLPAEKALIVGVIDTKTNSVEHPELVAQRLERFANIVGKERVIVGRDCDHGPPLNVVCFNATKLRHSDAGERAPSAASKAAALPSPATSARLPLA